MSAQVHYDADIFFAGQIIRNLKRGCSLKIDPDFFLDKVIEDIMFADDVLLKLSEKLNSNELLVNRDQYLRDLYLTKRDLVLFLEDLCGNVLNFSEHMKQYTSRFVQIIHNQKQNMMAIDDNLKPQQQKSDEKNIVSQEEYQILFDPDMDEE